MLELWPFTNFHDLNLDWIIKTVKVYTKKVDDFIEDINDTWNTFKNWVTHEIANMHRDFAIYVNATEGALNTGAIADGAITKQKIDSAFLKEIENNYVTPEMYGAVGDGLTDDTAAVQAAVNSGKNVWCLHTYKISETIDITEPIIIFGGKLIANDSIVLLNIESDNVKIYDMELDGDGTGLGGIHCENGENVFIEKIIVHDFSSNSTESAQGIYLRLCKHSAIKDCEVFNITGDETNTNMCQAIELSFCRGIEVIFCTIHDIECTPSGTHEADGIHIINDGKKDATYANEYDIVISDCIFGTCTKRAVKIQQSGVIVQNCLITEDAVNTQSWIACYYDDIIIRGCTILGTSPMPICIGVRNTVYPAGSTLKNIVIEDCYIINRSPNYQGAITLTNNKLENIVIRNNRLFSNSTVRAYGIVVQTDTTRSVITGNTFEKLTSDNIFTPFIFFQATSNNTTGGEILINGNTAKTNDTFVEIADSLEYADVIVSDNILDNDDVANMLSHRKYFVLYKNTSYVPTFKTATNIYPSGMVETYS